MRIERQKFTVTGPSYPKGALSLKPGDVFTMDVPVYNRFERTVQWLKRVWFRLRWGV